MRSDLLKWFVLLANLAQAVRAALPPTKDPASYVDTLIGTLNGGNVFAGPSAPFGSIKPGLDSDAPNNQAGFVPDGHSPIFGISALHDDGTGGRASLGMSSLLPQYCQLDINEATSGCKWTRHARRADIKHSSVKSTPGEFHFSLQSGVDVSMAASDHAAVYNIDFSDAIERGSWRSSRSATEEPSKRANNLEPVLVFDYMTDLQNSGRSPNNSLTTSSFVLPATSDSPATEVTRIETSATFSPSFGVGQFTVYTCLDVPLVRAMGTYEMDKSSPDAKDLTDVYGEAGVILTIDQDRLSSADFAGTLPVRIGISWTSTRAACNYASAEIPTFPSTKSLSTVALATRSKWNALLSDTLTISHDGLTPDDLTLFYSSLYRTFLSPNNVTGDNPRFSTTEPSYDSLYCIWDSARTVHPLWTLLAPGVQAEVVRSVVEIYRKEGWLPDCRMSTLQGFTQGGSNAEMLLSDSFVKGILRGDRGFWEDALEGMLKDAQIEPPSWGLVGRGGIEARRALGYVPRGEWGSPEKPGATPGRTASRTIEYAYNDFSIALVSAGLSHPTLYTSYRVLSNDTFNLWNTSIASDNFTGFLQARNEDGSWAYQDPRRCSPALEPFGCFLDRGEGHDFYEASSWQYSFFAPHDMAQVVELMGGSKRFVERYKHMWSMGYADIGDEPGFLAAYSANFAVGGYRHTVDLVVKLMREKFSTSKAGLPGNDDVGAMGSFIVWTHLGMFPVAGTGVYLLSTPLISAYEVRNAITGKVFRLKTRGWDGARRNKYIREAWLDGEKYTRNWLCHSVFERGGVLELVLGENPGEMGSREEDLPPSLSTGGFGYDSAVLGC
ncbi:glycosyl hydrolase [Pseudozyma hubeiensis SY62]|uniref:Glycosyl hydrolase n=1 Tax=Pseudozyma hubeiensis (strain SY62) TaxID=1305764 RepID=R9NZS9_PSEHS|nr:glycosyl hydrolase [Pseudozyma hubeiensis SY62]GAC94247.1 glycosyl hydrolase [Pseudozyma hubeiensis SY62]